MIAPGTPLPWECVDRARMDHPSVEVRGADEETVCYKYAPKDFEARDFAYIVHACNLYPELIEALEKIANPEFDCAPRQYSIAMQELALSALTKAGAA